MNAEFLKLSPEIKEKGGMYNQNHRKVKYFTGEFAVIATEIGEDFKPTSRTIIILKLYRTDARVYAMLLVFGRGDFYRVGSGYVQGYGYHMTSAAAAVAIKNAGIALDENIAGRGDEAIKEALLAIAHDLPKENRARYYWISHTHA